MAAPFNWHWTQWIMEWWCGPPLSGGGPPLHVKTISLVLRVRKCHPCAPSPTISLDRASFLHPLLPSFVPNLVPRVLLSLLLSRKEWISRSVSPFSKKNRNTGPVKRKDLFDRVYSPIFFTNDRRGMIDGFTVDTFFSLEGEGQIRIVANLRKLVTNVTFRPNLHCRANYVNW